jgi:hypothetical protein
MSIEFKIKKKKETNDQIKEQKKDETKEGKEYVDVCNTDDINKLYIKKCGNNKKLLQLESENRIQLGETENMQENAYLYPNLDDPNFNIKISEKKEFSDTKYDGTIYSVEDYAKVLSNAEYELLPQQAFVRNFMSFQTPYNSLLLFHGLGSGKTCSSIGVCEEMRDYLKQMGINKRIIIVASPNVQDNFKLQLFDERKLKLVDGIWTMKGCLGNKLLKEINPTGMTGLKKEKVIQQVKNLINASYSFKGYLQFSNEIVNKSGRPNDSAETKIRNLQNEYSDRLIVIDEVHNIRISDDNENKNVAKNLMYLVSVVSNLRLLLLSATPMFNSYKEIVWLLNLMNMNDHRGIVSVSDIFDANGSWKKDKDGNEIGKEMLIRKATGYVSYVRGENPYTFPFRVYPDRFSPKHTFQTIEEYPLFQINGKKIPNDRKISKLSLYLTVIGDYQKYGYNYIINRLRSRESGTKLLRTGKERKVSDFMSLKSFGYTDLQIPIEALNIVYPYDGLENIIQKMQPIEFIDNDEQIIDDISPTIKPAGEPEKDIVEEIDDVISSGPSFVTSVPIANANSELESEPAVTEGIEGDEKLFDKVEEPDSRNIHSASISAHSSNPFDNLSSKDSIFDTIDEPENDKDKETIDSLSSASVVSDNTSTSKSTSNSSFKGTLVPKKKKDSNSGIHIIEGSTVSQFPSEKNRLQESSIELIESQLSKSSNNNNNNNSSSSLKGGSDSINSSTEEEQFIDPKDLTGTQGLKRIMNYVDSKTPSAKGSFEYKRGVPHVFDNKEIGKYSSKIKTICNYIYDKENDKVSDGIILIYSSYIDAGVIPMALALEEMGFTRYGDKAKPLFKEPPCPLVDVRTMKPLIGGKKDFKPARYIMITGDPRISPNNDADVKAITSDDNIFKTDEKGNIVDISGEKIKVVLISQAGSEGLDFKAIRQVHILEPWYNMNRIEQIIGRGVRNFSHKDLPFTKRNVQIFLYGTILENTKEEAVDLYVYRISELKANKIGKVTRLLKQSAVDCFINHDQTEFTNDNFKELEENRDILQILSDHQKLTHFEIGDMDNSATCDFMKCDFDCLPNIDLDDSIINEDTYNEKFMLINSDKIIQKIKNLMKMRFFYKKNDLLQLINIPKKYPTTQIYAALTQIITDNTEYITDKYGRTGYLVNIGEYYLFQPSELNYKNISVYDRSVPIDYKHNMIKFEIKSNISKPVLDKKMIESIDGSFKDTKETKETKEKKKDKETIIEGKQVLESMFSNYKIALEPSVVKRGNDNWYEHCSIVIRKLAKEDSIIPAETDQKRVEILEKFLIEHIVDSLMMKEKVNLLNYLYAFPDIISETKDEGLKRFINKSKKYLFSKFIVSKGITGIVIFDGPSRIDNLNIYVLDNGEWNPAKPEDKRDLSEPILKKYKLKSNLNHYVGFIGFETNKKYMVYKVKDTENNRSTGFRCDQSGKEKIITLLNDIENDDRYVPKKTKEGAFELCVRQELTLRSYEELGLHNKSWFLDTETAIINEFEKKDKKK